MTRQQAGVSAEQVKEAWDAWNSPARPVGTVTRFQFIADRLNALATAPPEQASQKQPCECEVLCSKIATPLPPGRFCMADAAQEKMRAEPPQAGWQPHAVSAGALSAPDGYAFRYPDGIRFTTGEPINGSRPLDSIPYYFESSLVAHDQKVRVEVIEEAAQACEKRAIAYQSISATTSHECEQCAAAIRSLASGAEEKETK